MSARDEARARVMAKAAGERAASSSARVLNMLRCTNTTADAEAILDDLRAEVLAEVAAFLLAGRVARPLGEAEEHVNDVLTSLAAEVRTLPQSGAR
jgi:hypothetical protein